MGNLLKKVLYKVNFNKKFFGDKENVIRIFNSDYHFIADKKDDDNEVVKKMTFETGNLITAILYDLKKNKDEYEKIIKKETVKRNDYIAETYADIKTIQKKKNKNCDYTFL